MDALSRLKSTDAVRRLWDRDASLFSDDADRRDEVSQRLGWLGLAEPADPVGPQIRDLAATARRDLVTDLVLLGMGGSSLAPLVIARILASGPEDVRLHVLDTTAPATVLETLDGIEARSTWVLVSSKSGTTIEPLSLHSILRDWMEDHVEVDPGRHFLAVTDPGSPLEALAAEAGFRAVVRAPADVGGRFSALTPFGLLPAQIVGADTTALLQSARRMERLCRAEAARNPGALLAAFAAEAAGAGRDKLTLVTSPGLRPFGLWVEQLIAESTGKDGTGVVPVLETALAIPTGYGEDRAVVVLRYEDDDETASWAEVAAEEGSPVHETVVSEAPEIGGEFVRWEVATALLGMLLGIDPFDEPNVAEAKKATSEILDATVKAPAAAYTVDEAAVTYGGPLVAPVDPPALAEALDPLFDSLRPGDYLALLVYLPEQEELFDPLRRAAAAASATTGRAVCLELGPRYLHSTGQLHKGGPDEGAFLMVTARPAVDMPVPGTPYSLGELWRAQAEGDLATLSAHGRRVMRVDLASADGRAVQALAETLAAVASAARAL